MSKTRRKAILPTIVSNKKSEPGVGFLLRQCTPEGVQHYRTGTPKKWGPEITPTSIMSLQAASALCSRYQGWNSDPNTTYEVVEVLLQPVLLVDPA